MAIWLSRTMGSAGTVPLEPRKECGRCLLMENILPVPEINLPVFDQKSACYGSKVCPRSEALRGFSSPRESGFPLSQAPKRGLNPQWFQGRSCFYFTEINF
jgi:hypothetical protein